MPVFPFAETSRGATVAHPKILIVNQHCDVKEPYSKSEKSVKQENRNTQRRNAYKIWGQFSLPTRRELLHSEPAHTRKDAPKVNLHGIKPV